MTPEKESDDLALVRRFQAGDVRAFDAIVEAHFEAIGKLAVRLLGWRGDVQDVLQETFLVAYERLPQFEGRSQLRTWLAAIAIHVARRSLRRRRFRFWETAPEIAIESDCSLERDERAEQLRRAISRLGDSLREVIVLHYLEGKSIAETAEILGLRVNTVEVRLHRARKLLGAALEGRI